MLLIMGTGRSGTTWVAKLFDSHRDVFYLHEPDSIRRNHDLPFMPDRADIPGLKTAAADYLATLKTVRTPKATAHQPQFPKSYRSGLRAEFRRQLTLAAKGATHVPGVSENLVTLPDLFDRGKAPSLLVIKSVNSLCRTSLFAAADPATRFLHVIRHPAAVIASRLRARDVGIDMTEAYLPSLFALPEAKLYPFTHDDMITRPPAAQLAFSWMIQNDKAAIDADGEERIRTVIYEKLCADIVGGLTPLFAFAGLDWTDEVTAFVERLKNVRTSDVSYFDILRPPTASLHKWRTELSSDEIAAITEITQHARHDHVMRAAQFD